MSSIFSKKFYEQTNFDFPIGMQPRDPQYWPKSWKEIYYKEYPRFPKTPLSKNFLKLGDFEESLHRRHSSREFNPKAFLSKEELSTLLYYSAGVKPGTETDPNLVRRFYPSGGGLYPIEVYLCVQRVEGIKPGICHYNVREHSLETLTLDAAEIDRLKEGLYYPWSRDAAVIFLFTCVWSRNMVKYKKRGYRIILMEVSHMAHNLALVAASLNIGCCNSVGFHNQRINEVLDITHEGEDSLYAALLGR